MIDRLIDGIEGSIHFLFLFWKNNPIYLFCSIFYYVISSLLLGGTGKSFLIVFVVYARSKEKYKRLRKIEICVIDNMTVNAMALGRRTIAVTKGAMQTFTEEELKAVMGHEVAHLIHGDTMATMYAVIGNGILSVFVLLARLFLLLLDWIQTVFNGKRGFLSILILLLKLYFEFSIWILNFGLQVILSVNSRKNEFKADMFSYAIGYDSDMIEALYLLEKISLGDNSTIIQKMIATHPRITLRIKKLEEFDNILMK